MKSMSMKNLTNLTTDNKQVSNLLKNDYVSWGLKILLVLYAAMVAPQLNRQVSMIFDNIIVRLIIAVLIVFLSFYDVTLAILLAICFVVSIQTLNKHKITSITTMPENFANNEMEDDMEEEDMEDNMMMENNQENMENFRNMSMEGTETNNNMMMMEGTETNNNMMMMEGTETNNNMMMMEGTENFMGGAMPEENYMRVDGLTEQENRMTNNQNLSNDVSMCGGPNNQFTTQTQLYDAGNNYVNQNQNNSVATFCPELNPQGFNSPSGTNLSCSLQSRSSNF